MKKNLKMGKRDLGMLAVMALALASVRGLDKALKDIRNSAGNQKYTPPNTKGYYASKSIRANQNYSPSHKPLFYRKII